MNLIERQPRSGVAATFVDRLTEYISPVDPCWAETISPAREDDIARYLEVSGLARAGLSLPESYLQFLSRMGEDDGGIFRTVLADARLSRFCAYYSADPDPEDIDNPELPIIARYETGDDISLDLRGRPEEPEVHDTNFGEDIRFLAGSFEKWTFQCAFKRCEELRFPNVASWSASERDLRATTTRTNLGNGPGLVRDIVDREGFTPLWFSDRENHFLVREDASLYYEHHGFGILIVLYGGNKATVKRLGTVLPSAVGARAINLDYVD
ncbi:MAG TPA: SMI1/KNR4 family protein [Methanocella sp.]|nr:SMI1/KNR4 family protein [Methanocella sp.]